MYNLMVVFWSFSMIKLILGVEFCIWLISNEITFLVFSWFSKSFYLCPKEILRKVRSILNKLTPQKFQTLTQQIIDLEINTQERLEGAIDLIFEKVGFVNILFSYQSQCHCL